MISLLAEINPEMNNIATDLSKESGGFPELPNVLTLVHTAFHGSEWVEWMHAWEAILFSLFIAVVVSIVFYLATKKPEMVPRGLQNVVELFVETLSNFVMNTLGEEGKKFIPLLGTLFIYIITMNLVGLVPFMKAPSSNLNVTIGLALVVFGLVQYLNVKNMGVGGFIYHMAGSPKTFLDWLMVPLMFPLEIITQLSRPVTLAFRLFGNVMGEDVLIGVFAAFGLAFLAHYNSPIGLPLQIPFMFLALLTGTMQALVFTLLSTVYILLSMPKSH